MLFSELLTMDPVQEINRVQREMNRLFEDAWRTTGLSLYPAVNIWSNDEAVMVTAELPEYRPEDIHLSVVGNELTIKGHRPKYELREGEHLLRQERPYGQFERVITLPHQIETDRVEAVFKNGVLHITLPRAEADKPRKIQIKSK